MEIILSPLCCSFTGTYRKGCGYAIRMRRSHNGKKHFYTVRCSRNVPPDGHWRCILDCANLAMEHLLVDDIHITMAELKDALAEAGINHFLWYEENRNFLNAKDILTLKHINNL